MLSSALSLIFLHGRIRQINACTNLSFCAARDCKSSACLSPANCKGALMVIKERSRAHKRDLDWATLIEPSPTSLSVFCSFLVPRVITPHELYTIHPQKAAPHCIHGAERCKCKHMSPASEKIRVECHFNGFGSASRSNLCGCKKVHAPCRFSGWLAAL